MWFEGYVIIDSFYVVRERVSNVMTGGLEAW
jgi:hypothetical protein